MKVFSRLLCRLQRPTAGAKIQFLSDLHLEIGQQYSSFVFPSSAQHLVLAGDIGRLIDYVPYLKFLQDLVPRYKRVFLALGNHEFYGTDYNNGIQAAIKLEQEECLQGKLTLLQKKLGGTIPNRASRS